MRGAESVHGAPCRGESAAGKGGAFDAGWLAGRAAVASPQAREAASERGETASEGGDDLRGEERPQNDSTARRASASSTPQLISSSVSSLGDLS